MEKTVLADDFVKAMCKVVEDSAKDYPMVIVVKRPDGTFIHSNCDTETVIGIVGGAKIRCEEDLRFSMQKALQSRGQDIDNLETMHMTVPGKAN